MTPVGKKLVFCVVLPLLKPWQRWWLINKLATKSLNLLLYIIWSCSIRCLYIMCSGLKTYHRTGSATRCILISLIDILGCATGIRKIISCFSWMPPNKSWKWFFHHIHQTSRKNGLFPVPFCWKRDAFWTKYLLVSGWLGLNGWGLGYSKAEEDEEDEEWLPRKSDVEKEVWKDCWTAAFVFFHRNLVNRMMVTPPRIRDGKCQ